MGSSGGVKPVYCPATGTTATTTETVAVPLNVSLLQAAAGGQCCYPTGTFDCSSAGSPDAPCNPVDHICSKSETLCLSDQATAGGCDSSSSGGVKPVYCAATGTTATTTKVVPSNATTGQCCYPTGTFDCSSAGAPDAPCNPVDHFCSKSETLCLSDQATAGGCDSSASGGAKPVYCPA